ncbi:GGDEF domain-containing protein [Lactococcus lactis]|uniref:GGDEF domain-containing protein n=1 Tax=Lactococcus lactis TaxID=1358 RepID=UPI000C9F7E41|nr:GGDEF domain-containing protein [Lactococcus lactis]AUS69139.1 hypothetical protein LLG50_03315 [Lactococcus lactis subsp. lactis]
MVSYLQDVLGANFIIKMMLLPIIIFLIFIVIFLFRKIGVHKYKNLYFIFYTINLAAWIIFAKLIFNQIDPGEYLDFLFSDLSLILVIIFYILIMGTYKKNFISFIILLGIVDFSYFKFWYSTYDLKSVLYVSAASVLFILSGKYISENRETLPKRPFPYILSSVIFVNAGWLFMSSRDSLNWNLYIGLIAKFIIIMLLVRFSIFMVTNFLFEHRKALSEAILDDLTQTYNKRHFINTLESILSEISNFKDFPVSISIFDVDSFKQINDELSHLAGDYVLETLCKEIKKELSTKKIGGQLFRYGGDEFVIIFRNFSGGQSQKMMKDILDRINSYKFIYKAKPIKVTISSGISEMKKNSTLSEVLESADKNLYKAKIMGKNQVVYEELK